MLELKCGYKVIENNAVFANWFWFLPQGQDLTLWIFPARQCYCWCASSVLLIVLNFSEVWKVQIEQQKHFNYFVNRKWILLMINLCKKNFWTDNRENCQSIKPIFTDNCNSGRFMMENYLIFMLNYLVEKTEKRSR